MSFMIPLKKPRISSRRHRKHREFDVIDFEKNGLWNFAGSIADPKGFRGKFDEKGALSGVKTSFAQY